MAAAKKGKATKRVQETVCRSGDLWTIEYGELRRGRGRPPKTERLFRVVGEKIPFDSLDAIEDHLGGKALSRRGVYVAHDSMGAARYIGRGDIFGRLKAHKKAHIPELLYFSFYVVLDKTHERELETVLIRAAGPQLHFNERKKRVDIAPGDVRDFEPGTYFYERQRRRGPRPKR